MRRVQARELQAGDVLIPTGRTVLARPTAGVRTPSGKVELTLDCRGEARRFTFNSRTVVTVA